MPIPTVVKWNVNLLICIGTTDCIGKFVVSRKGFIQSSDAGGEGVRKQVGEQTSCYT